MNATAWHISDINGKSLGLYSAMAPESAFCQYLGDQGIEVTESDVEVRSVYMDSVMLVFRSSEYVLTSMSSNPAARSS
jgi:hypothetical protein